MRFSVVDSTRMPRCPQCGEENPERAKFCLNCAAPLRPEAAPSREARKTVTVLFCDVTGSTALGEQLDPERLGALLARYFERMKAIVERHGGTVEKFIEETLRLIRRAVEVEAVEPLALKGKAESVPAYRLLSVSAEGPRRPVGAPMAGRGREQRLLADAWERVASERSCHLFTILGPAGVGKSRLAGPATSSWPSAPGSVSLPRRKPTRPTWRNRCPKRVGCYARPALWSWA